MRARKELPVTFLLLSCPSSKRSGCQSSTPRKRIKFRKRFQQRFSRAKTLVTEMPGSKKVRNLHIEIYFKSEAKKKKKSQNSNQLSVWYCLYTEKESGVPGSSSCILTWLLLNTSKASPSCSGKAFFYRHVQDWYVWFVSLELPLKEAPVFCWSSSCPSIRVAVPCASSRGAEAGPARWIREHMHLDCILLPKWNVGICYAPQVEKWPRNQSKGWYIIYIYQCYYS